jgi:hypothetical protein
LSGNTIYVLNADKVITAGKITMNNCNAIVSSGATVIYSQSQVNSNGHID